MHILKLSVLVLKLENTWDYFVSLFLFFMCDSTLKQHSGRCVFENNDPIVRSSSNTFSHLPCSFLRCLSG